MDRLAAQIRCNPVAAYAACRVAVRAGGIPCPDGPGSMYTSSGVRPSRLDGATLVVEPDPLANALAGLAAAFEGVQIYTFILQGAPEPFDHHVVHPAALAVHGDADPGVLQHLQEILARELAALIRVEDFRRPMAAQRLFQ